MQKKLNEAKGPITVVSGKKKRLIDIGKINDLVLLMVDGSSVLKWYVSHQISFHSLQKSLQCVLPCDEDAK
jgi:hypothetical protein